MAYSSNCIDIILESKSQVGSCILPQVALRQQPWCVLGVPLIFPGSFFFIMENISQMPHSKLSVCQCYLNVKL